MALVEVCGCEREGNGRRTVRPPVLNSGSGAINGEDDGQPWKSKGLLPSEPAQRTTRTLPGDLRIGGQLARLSVSLRIILCLHASRLVKVKQLCARHLLQPLKLRHVASREWLKERTWFELYKCLRYLSASYFFKMPLLAVIIRVRLLSKWTRKIPQHVGCHSMIAWQVS